MNEKAITAGSLNHEMEAHRQSEAQYRDWLRIITELSASFAEAASDYCELANTVTRRIAEITGDTCLLALLSDDEQWLEPLAHFDADPLRLADLLNILSSTPLKANEGLAGQAIRTGRAIYLPKIYAWQLLPMMKTGILPVLEKIGMRSLILVPLQARGEVLGLLFLIHCRSDLPPLSEEDLLLAKDIACRTAMAIAHDRLLEKHQGEIAARRRKELEADTLRRLVATQATSRDLDHFLESLLIQLQNVLPFDRAGVLLLEDGCLKLLASRGGSILGQELGFEYLLARVLSTGVQPTPQPVFIPDASLDNRFPRLGDRTESARGWMSLPLLVREELVGYLTLESRLIAAYNGSEALQAQPFANQAAVAIHSARQYENSQRQARQLSGLYNAALATTSVLEVEELLRRIYEQVQLLIAPDVFAVSLFDEDTNKIRLALVMELGKESPQLVDLGVPLEESGFTGWVLRTRKPFYVRDIRSDKVPPAPNQITVSAQAWLGVPLISHDRLVGVMSVQSYRPGAFDDDHRRLLESLGAQVATALENAHLFEETRRRAVQLRVAAEIARDATAAPELDLLLDRAVKLVRDRFGYYFAAIFLVGGRSEYAILKAATGDAGRQLLEAGHKLRIRLEKDNGAASGPDDVPVGLVGTVAATGQPRVVPDVAQDDVYYKNPLLPETRSEMALPLKVGQRIIGVLDVQSRQVANFDDHDVKILQILADQLAIALENARLYQELEEAYLQAVLSLANAMEVRDSYTGGHSQRLALWAGAVARQLGCSEDEIQAIHWAALLHDIGKIGVPDAILKKPGELTDEEWVVMKQHPELGAQIVAPVKNLKQVAPLIRYHQEEYIGTGYPYGLRKEEIPLGARILAVVDAYSAITDERVYRKGRSHAEALAEMQRCAGTQFDPQVVEAFLRVIQDSS